MKEKYDTYVFISYASLNRDHARELYERLTGKWHRIPCWMDEFDILVDEHEFQEHILSGIKNASALVMVKTVEAMKSIYVGREVAEARATGIPVFHYKVKSFFNKPAPLDPGENGNQKEGLANARFLVRADTFLRSLRIAWLALRIKMRITLPFWLSTLMLGLIVVAMGLGIYLLGKTVTPVVAGIIQRSLPDAVDPSASPQFTPAPQDPKTAAPFHFVVTSALLADDFDTNGVLDETIYPFDIKPTFERVKIHRQGGSLLLVYPNQCLTEEFRWVCETEIHTQYYPLPAIQYFGLRVRLLEHSQNQEISLSISTTGPSRFRTGFGWAFSDHVTPFFRSNPNLPEEDYYAYLPLDDQWHAYEIILDPEAADLFYYMDGQLIDKVSMNFYEEWEPAPLMFLTYALAAETIPLEQVDHFSGTQLEIDQVIVGGFE